MAEILIRRDTAAPTGKVTKPTLAEQARNPVRQYGGAGAWEEHKFMVMSLDKKTGKTLWARVAKVAMPHESCHREYGSFATNSPVTDCRYLCASFGPSGIYRYDLDGKLIWEKDLGMQMMIRAQVGEGATQALHGNLLIHPFLVNSADRGRQGKETGGHQRDQKSAGLRP